MISCAANSVLLSVVMVLTDNPLPLSSLTTACASGTARFPESSFSMSMKQLFLSTKVTIAPLPSFPTIMSISQSPTVCPLACAGLSSMETRFGIGVLVPEAELLAFLPMRVRDKDSRAVVPLGIIGARCSYPEPTRIFFRPMRLFFVLPPRRKILSVIFFIFLRGGKYFPLIYLTSPVEEDRSFFFLLSSATAESLPFFIELYIELASPSVPEMPANVVLVVREIAAIQL